jgi:Tol biopolymer transport system component
MKNLLLTLLTAAVALSTATAQIEVLSLEKLALPGDQDWGYPRFSPDGRSIFLSNSEFDGIWQYALDSRELRQLTDDPKSGYAFSVSADGQVLAYRRTFFNDRTYERTQELVMMRLQDGETSVVASSRRLSTPAFAGNTLTYAEQPVTESFQKTAAPAGTILLGIENTKIALLTDGVKTLLDPLGNAQYIWPSLSADGKRLVAYAMQGGTFVYDLESRSIAKLGRRNAAVWTRSGNWIVYMDDRDDGHRILSSDILCVSPAGGPGLQLTATPDVIELYPQCSPVEDRITFHTLNGDIYVLTYREVRP